MRTSRRQSNQQILIDVIVQITGHGAVLRYPFAIACCRLRHRSLAKNSSSSIRKRPYPMPPTNRMSRPSDHILNAFLFSYRPLPLARANSYVRLSSWPLRLWTAS